MLQRVKFVLILWLTQTESTGAKVFVLPVLSHNTQLLRAQKCLIKTPRASH
jgi:hypothetical protein